MGKRLVLVLLKRGTVDQEQQIDLLGKIKEMESLGYVYSSTARDTDDHEELLGRCLDCIQQRASLLDADVVSDFQYMYKPTRFRLKGVAYKLKE